MLYSYKGGEPQELPFRIVLSNGKTRTSQTPFTEEELADAGYVPVPDAVIAPERLKEMSPVQFKMLLTPQERIAIRTARATDPVIDDFMDILEDVRLTEVDRNLQSVQDMVTYLVSQALLTQERADAILSD